MSEARFSRERLAALGDQVDDFHAMLDGVEIAGYPKRATELARLRELIDRYPEQARQILAELNRR